MVVSNTFYYSFEGRINSQLADHILKYPCIRIMVMDYDFFSLGEEGINI